MINKTLILTIIMVVAPISAYAQDTNKNIIADPKPSVTVLPKLALKGAVAYERDGKQYHKIILIVINRDKLSAKMFELQAGEKLPPNPCGEKVKTRVVLSVFSEDGKPVASCLLVASRQALESPSFLIEKGKTVPEYVYIILTDIKTDSTYKSNVVSPYDGMTK